MAEELTGLGAQAPAVGGETSIAAPAETPEEQEKFVPQSQVNQLIGQKKTEAYQKGKADALAELNAKAAAPAQNSAQETGNAQQQSGKTIEQIVEEKLSQQNYAMHRQQVMNNFVQKMQEGPKKYTDFDEKVAQLNLPAIEPILHLANAVENSEDVMYDLASNPGKVSKLFDELEKGRPHIALMMVKELAKSAKVNQQAAKQQTPDEPLSQIKPSNVGMDNGSQSVSSIRKKNYLRV